MRNPLPANYRPPDLSDYEEPLDLIDDGLIDLSSALRYQADGLTMYASTSFMNAANRFREAGEQLRQYREQLLRFIVPRLWDLSENAEHIDGVTPMRPDISVILENLEGIITAENYLWTGLSSWRKVERIRKILQKRNPDIDLRQLAREYAASPSPELMDKIIRARERMGNFRFFMHGEGWQAQTTFPPEIYDHGPEDGCIVSSATESHDGWWGVGHVTWTGDSEIRDLGDHSTGPRPGPLPTREQVAKAHFEVVRKVEDEGVEAISPYHRWSSYRDNPGSDVRLRMLEREYSNQPSPEILRRLNAARERAGIEVELPVQHLQMLFEDMISLLGKTLEDANEAPGSILKGAYDVFGSHKIQGFYGSKFIKLTAYNLYDPMGEYTNVHINVEKYRSGIKRAYQKASVELYPDDVIYISKSSRLAFTHGLAGDDKSYTLPPNQPWAYNAKDLLDYVVKEL